LTVNVVKCAAASANLRFQFQKRGQLFIRTHNKPLSVIPMRISNPDCSPVGIRVGKKITIENAKLWMRRIRAADFTICLFA